MNEKQKDERLIPKGQYCYEHIGRNGEGRSICPYFTKKTIIYDNTDIYNDVIQIPWCSYLNEGDIGLLNDRQIERLTQHYGCTVDRLNEMYPLDLLWDWVKECGVNMGEDEYE